MQYSLHFYMVQLPVVIRYTHIAFFLKRSKNREILQILSNEVAYNSEDDLESIDENDEEVTDLDNFLNLCTEDLIDDILENIDNENFTQIISEFDNPLDKNISLINVEEYPTLGTTNDSSPRTIVTSLSTNITTNIPVKITRSQKRKNLLLFYLPQQQYINLH
ncbi:hypothetical protein QTP88_022818 [Uroleucon formosanum]